jgi:tRNA-dihydrouridine synthase
VSLKTRLGYERETVESWFSFLLQLQPPPDLITVHGRTLKQGYQGEANWQAIKQVVRMRQELAPTVAIYGNGDINSFALAKQRAAASGVDGIMIGRAALGNPWVFQPQPTPPTLAQRTAVALAHAQLIEQTYGVQDHYRFDPMRKYLAAYVKGLPEATSLRAKLVLTNNSREVARIFAQIPSLT